MGKRKEEGERGEGNLKGVDESQREWKKEEMMEGVDGGRRAWKNQVEKGWKEEKVSWRMW